MVEGHVEYFTNKCWQSLITNTNKISNAYTHREESSERINVWKGIVARPSPAQYTNVA